VVAGLTGWGVLLGVAGYVSARADAPTIREQTSVADARPSVDRAVATLVAAGVAADAVVSVSPFTRLGTCRISAARDGERWEQAVSLFTRSGQESALLDRIAAGLPGDWRARIRPRGELRTLRADAGNFVALSGGSATSGEVRITAATGCRAPADGAAGGPLTGEPPAVERAPLEAVLGALKLTGARWSTYRISCPGGGELRVVTATAEPDAPPLLPSALGGIGPDPVLAEPARYAYRTGDVSVLVRVNEEGVTISGTTPCPSR
jgi:hypothetical protein